MEYTILEWNIGSAGGFKNYEIPHFITNTILEKEPDVVVLVEFFIGKNFGYIREKFEDKYFIFISPFAYNHNQIMIALKKSKFEEKDIKSVVTNNIMDKDCPEYLQVDICKETEKKEFSIIGTRIKTSGSNDNRNNQFSFLDEKFENLDKVICTGDFNATITKVNKLFKCAEVYGPRIFHYTRKNARWSFIHEEGDKVAIDLIVSKNISIPKDAEDELSQREYKMYANYDWEFVKNENGYGSLSSNDYISKDIRKPDQI